LSEVLKWDLSDLDKARQMNEMQEDYQAAFTGYMKNTMPAVKGK